MKHFHKFLFTLVLFYFGTTFSFAQKDTKTKSSKYEIQGPYCNGLARVRMNKKWGYIDKDGKEVVKPKYKQVENFDEGIARVRNAKGWGLIDTTGVEILIPAYDFISEFVDGKAKISLMGQEA